MYARQAATDRSLEAIGSSARSAGYLAQRVAIGDHSR